MRVFSTRPLADLRRADPTLLHVAAPRTQAMKAQASYSSWYFVERAAIGDIRVNCTIALSSAILASSRRTPTPADASRAKVGSTLYAVAAHKTSPSAGAFWQFDLRGDMPTAVSKLAQNALEMHRNCRLQRQDSNVSSALQASLFGRVIGAAGFQLINVNNVSLRLGGWQTDTQLVSRKALTATLARHFRDEFIKEAHKARLTCCTELETSDVHAAVFLHTLLLVRLLGACAQHEITQPQLRLPADLGCCTLPAHCHPAADRLNQSCTGVGRRGTSGSGSTARGGLGGRLGGEPVAEHRAPSGWRRRHSLAHRLRLRPDRGAGAPFI